MRVASVIGGDLMDLATSHGDLFVSLRAFFAAEDNRKRAERTRAAWVTQAKRGRKPGSTTPFGLVFDPVGAGAWSLHPDRAELVREMFERVAGGESCYEIALDFDLRGAPRKDRGKRWTRQRVWEIVRSRYPVGEWLGHVELHIVVPVPPIVDEDLWQRAQVAMRSQGKRGLRRTRYPYLLEAMARCGRCDSPIHVRTGNSGRNRYYLCARRLDRHRGPHCCTAPILAVTDVDGRVWREIERQLDDPALPEMLAARATSRAEEQRDWKADAAGYRKHLARLDRVRGAVLVRFRRGAIGEAVLDTELAGIDRESGAVQEQLRAAERAIAAAEGGQGRVTAASALVARLRAATSNATPEVRREIARALIVPGSMVFHGTDVEFTLDLLDLADEAGGSGSVREPISGQNRSRTRSADALRIRVVA